MTSKILLELDHHAVRLLLREASKDVEIGSVRLDDPDFEARLSRLKGEVSSEATVEAQMLLPPPLVLFIDVHGMDDAAIKARIDADTPCDLDELAIGRMDGVAAAVERATLEEARDFAVAHGFTPVGFSARRADSAVEVGFSLEHGPIPTFRSQRAAEEHAKKQLETLALQGPKSSAPVAKAFGSEAAAAMNPAEALTVLGARERRRERRNFVPLYAAAVAAALAVLFATFFVARERDDVAIVDVDDGVLEVGDPAIQGGSAEPTAAAGADEPAADERPQENAEGSQIALDRPATPPLDGAASGVEPARSAISAPVDLSAPMSVGPVNAPPDLTPPDAPEIADLERAQPPPPGTVFDMDEHGLVRPSVDGSPTPQGVLVYSGTPPVLPPERPNTSTEEGEAPSPPDPVAGSADNAAMTPPPGSEAVAAPDILAIRPQPRPQDAAIPIAPVVAEATDETPRPRNRPDDLVADVRASGSTDFETLAEQARAQSGAATAAIVASRAAEPPPPEPVGRLNVAVQPSLPTRASVAKQATLTNAIRLDRLSLIGVYGSPSDRRALIRLPSGRYLKVKVGDRLDGGRIAAIQASRLEYVKGGRSYDLKMPNG